MHNCRKPSNPNPADHSRHITPMAAVRTFVVPHYETYPVHVAAFRDVANSAFLRTQLLDANPAFDYAFLDAEMVCCDRTSCQISFSHNTVPPREQTSFLALSAFNSLPPNSHPPQPTVTRCNSTLHLRISASAYSPHPHAHTRADRLPSYHCPCTHPSTSNGHDSAATISMRTVHRPL